MHCKGEPRDFVYGRTFVDVEETDVQSLRAHEHVQVGFTREKNVVPEANVEVFAVSILARYSSPFLSVNNCRAPDGHTIGT